MGKSRISKILENSYKNVMFKSSVPSGDFTLGEYSDIYTYAVALPVEKKIHIVDPTSVPVERFGRKYLTSKDMIYSLEEVSTREGQEDLKSSIEDVLQQKDSTLKFLVIAPDEEGEGIWSYSPKQFRRWIVDSKKYSGGVFTPSVDVVKVNRA